MIAATIVTVWKYENGFDQEPVKVEDLAFLQPRDDVVIDLVMNGWQPTAQSVTSQMFMKAESTLVIEVPRSE